MVGGPSGQSIFKISLFFLYFTINNYLDDDVECEVCRNKTVKQSVQQRNLTQSERHHTHSDKNTKKKLKLEIKETVAVNIYLPAWLGLTPSADDIAPRLVQVHCLLAPLYHSA